jgi:HAD superfamily hydrolase (TIGR01459 family)
VPTRKTLQRQQRQLQTTQEQSASMKLVDGISQLVDDYDVFLLDMWGLLHDGSRPFDGVLQTIANLKESGKTMIILSNSSKRQVNSVKMLKKLGFDPADFDQIITSGEVAHQILSGGVENEWDLLAKARQDATAFIFGSGDGDAEYCESCGWTPAPINEASLIIARGTFTINDGSSVIHKKDDPDEYDRVLNERLHQAAARGIPMLVSNPDKIRPDSDRSPMPGMIGDSYDQALTDAGKPNFLLKRIGKPFDDVFKIALQNISPDLSRVCMIGDALETDVVSGSSFGIATVWVLADGIYSAEVRKDAPLFETASNILKTFNGQDRTYANGKKISPTIMMPHFKW